MKAADSLNDIRGVAQRGFHAEYTATYEVPAREHMVFFAKKQTGDYSWR